MFQKLLNIFKKKQLPQSDPSYETVTVGDPSHQHSFREVEWDNRRFGPSVTDFTAYYAIFKTAYRCHCGAERIKGVNALY